MLAERYAGVPFFGSDSAVIGAGFEPDDVVVASSDPCPRPAAFELGFTDLYYLGWLLGTINLSDLAAAGARPLALLTSLVLPPTLAVGAFLRLLDGVDDCVSEVGAVVAGGNLKEGQVIDASATAIGVAKRSSLLGRRGGRPGDMVVLIGNTGFFWSAFLLKRAGLAVDPLLLKNVLTPRAKVRIAGALARERVLTSCMDNSDGVLASLHLLAEASGCGLRLRFDELKLNPLVGSAAAQLGVPALRLAVGWGDWQLIGTCPAGRLARLVELCDEEVHVIGEVCSEAGVMGEHEGRLGALSRRIDSERFVPGSWLSAGLEGYIQALLEAPIVEGLP